MNVYFARALRGVRLAASETLYDGIIKAIKDAGHKTQFTISHGIIGSQRVFMSPEQYIYERDVAWIDRCQAMVAEVSTASLGVGYEIAYAQHVAKIPIFCAVEKEASLSAMISGCPAFEIFRYRDLGDLSAGIETFLDSLASS